MREASANNVSCDTKHVEERGWDKLTVCVNAARWDRSFSIQLHYIPSRHRSVFNPALGKGEINGEWELVLPQYHPYRWEVYRRPEDQSKVADYSGGIPDYYLDAALLTTMLREKLEGRPSSLR